MDEDVEEEFGEGLLRPSEGWASLSQTLEFAIAAGPLVLLKPGKLAIFTVSRTKKFTHVGDQISKIVHLNTLQSFSTAMS